MYGFRSFDIHCEGSLQSLVQETWLLTNMVMHHMVVDNQEDPLLNLVGTTKVLNQVATNADTLFSTKV